MTALVAAISRSIIDSNLTEVALFSVVGLFVSAVAIHFGVVLVP